MIYQVYVIGDRVSEEYNVPFFQKNDASAKRAFTDTINRSIRPLKNLKVEDFELYRIGFYDTSLGIFTSIAEKFLVANGAEVEVYDYEEPAAVPFTPEQLREQFSKQLTAMTAQNPTKPAKKSWFRRSK